jgi:hypothetical protein
MTINIIDRGEALQLYLDYFNNFLSVGRFAEYYELRHDHALEIIKLGRETLNNQLYEGQRITIKRS